MRLAVLLCALLTLLPLAVCSAAEPVAERAEDAEPFPVSPVWARTPLDGEGVVAYMALPLANGNLLVTGDYNLPDVYEPPSAYMVLLGPDGDVLQRVLRTETPEVCLWSGAALPDGGAVLAGTGDCYQTEREAYGDIVLLRLNAAGAVLWEKPLSLPGTKESASGLMPLPDGTLLLTGMVFAENREKGLLASLDQDGNVRWRKTLETPITSAALDVARDRVVLASASREDSLAPHTTVQAFSYSGLAGHGAVHEGFLDVSADPFVPGRLFLSGMTRRDQRERPAFFVLNAALGAGPAIFPETATHGYLTEFLRDTPDSVLLFAPGDLAEPESPAPAVLRIRLDGTLISREPVGDPWPFVFARNKQGGVFVAGRKDGPARKQDFLWVARLAY